MLTLKTPITTAVDGKFSTIYPNIKKIGITFHENCLPADDSHEISSLKSSEIWNCRLLQIIGGALLVNIERGTWLYLFLIFAFLFTHMT